MDVGAVEKYGKGVEDEGLTQDVREGLVDTLHSLAAPRCENQSADGLVGCRDPLLVYHCPYFRWAKIIRPAEVWSTRVITTGSWEFRYL